MLVLIKHESNFLQLGNANTKMCYNYFSMNMLAAAAAKPLYSDPQWLCILT